MHEKPLLLGKLTVLPQTL